MVGNDKKVVMLSCSSLKSYPGHLFRLYKGKRLEDLKESIKKHGVMTPILVKPLSNSYYTILSGHNRVQSCRQLGIENIPCIILDQITEEEAELVVLESNLLQRSFSEMAESEKSEVIFSWSMAKRRRKQTEVRNAEIKALIGSVEQIEKKKNLGYNLGDRTIGRYLRVYKAHQDLKELLDNAQISVVAVEALSFIDERWQIYIANKVKNGWKIKQSVAMKIHDMYSELSEEVIDNILAEEKKEFKCKITENMIEQYFSHCKTEKEMTEHIHRALEYYYQIQMERTKKGL